MTREEARELFEDNFTVINTHGHYTKEEEGQAQELAISALSADVKSNIHAEWEKVSADKYIKSANYRYRCSMCGELTIGEPNFCPTCGADMRGNANE